MSCWAMERALQGELTGLVNFQRAPKDFAAAAERNRSARRKNFQRPLKTKFYTIELVFRMFSPRGLYYD